MKTCRKCGLSKEPDEFSKKSDTRDGLHPWCKTCDNANKLRIKSERSLEAQAAHRESRPEKACAVCKRTRPNDEYTKRVGTEDGLQPLCKGCAKTERAERKKAVTTEIQETLRTERPDKICGTCKKTKINSEFQRNSWAKDGLDSRCRECKKTYGQDYHKKKPDAARRGNDKRKALGKATFVEPVNPWVLFERDGGLCQLCCRPVDMRLRAPHRMSWSRDHIVPLSKGGETSYANMQLVHFGCNSSKGNRA